MSDELLPYFEKELAFIRQMGTKFSKEQPKIASRLGVNSDTIEDPHVSRLIESFAYLNARIQHKLDDDLPEISDSFLNILFPHYQRPIPSMSIVRFSPDEEQLDAAYTVPKSTVLETDLFKGERCHFTTIYPTELIPVNVTDASILGRPFITPGSESCKGAECVLKISLSSFSKDIIFSELNLNKIRFHLKGQTQHIHPLYELLLNNCINVVVTDSEDDVAPVYLGKDCIKAVGFNEEDGILPYPDASFTGYRLLTEYFVFPEKFMFVDFTNLTDKLGDKNSNELIFYIYLSSSDIELEHNINKQTFLTGCTPAVNLFKQKADPIKLDHTQQEYQIIPDIRRPAGFEVYSIDNVTATNSAGEQHAFHPIYGLTHKHQDSKSHSFWLGTRRSAKMNDYERDEATDMFISPIDLNFNPNNSDDRVLLIETTCSNRNQAAKLPFNNEQPKLQAVDSSPPCNNIRCISRPTPTIQPPLRDQARWRLLSHLNLNHLSITGRDKATDSVKEILRLYNFTESAASRAVVASISSVNAHAISAPLNIDGRATLCRGIEIEITLEDTQLSGSSSYLFASVLEHFFSAYCSINSFTRVLVKLKNKEGYLKKCPPRSGKKVLL